MGATNRLEKPLRRGWRGDIMTASVSETLEASMASILDGKVVSGAVKERLKAQVAALPHGAMKPGLAVVLVGEDPASKIYVGNKEKACQDIGYHSVVHRLPADTREEAFAAPRGDLNATKPSMGFWSNCPFQGLRPHKVVLAIDPGRRGWLAPRQPGFVGGGIAGPKSCTPYGVMEMLRHYDSRSKANARWSWAGATWSKTHGSDAPFANATVTQCHSRTRDLSEEFGGRYPRRGHRSRPFRHGGHGQTGGRVVDVGTNRPNGGKLCGDVDFGPVSEVASAITPVPGGVGLMTIAMLMQNTWDAFCAQTGRT
jgi:methylenetetrahydrofolate dehydrogenase (NADP+)/methenyltetrahydrofolate cyclohydrolase